MLDNCSDGSDSSALKKYKSKSSYIDQVEMTSCSHLNKQTSKGMNHDLMQIVRDMFKLNKEQD